jgi:hypothetical protein
VKPPDDKNITAREKGKFEMYGLQLLNNGEKAYNVRVVAFRTKMGLTLFAVLVIVAVFADPLFIELLFSASKTIGKDISG